MRYAMSWFSVSKIGRTLAFFIFRRITVDVHLWKKNFANEVLSGLEAILEDVSIRARGAYRRRDDWKLR